MIETLLLKLIQDKSFRWETDTFGADILKFDLGNWDKLHVVHIKNGINIAIYSDYSVKTNYTNQFNINIKNFDSVRNFFNEITRLGQMCFMSYEKEFPDDFIRVSKLTEKVLKGEKLESRYKVYKSEKNSEETVINIVDKIFNCTNQLIINLPSKRYLGNYYIEGKFYPFKEATSTMSMTKLIPVTEIGNYSYLQSIVPTFKCQPSEILDEKTEQKFIANLQECKNFKSLINSILLMNELPEKQTATMHKIKI